MKVLLVRPNSDFPSNFPPLGLLHLASYLRQRGQYEIRIVDGRNTFETPDQIAYIAKDFNADVVGISSLAADSQQAATIAQSVKAELPNVAIVLGGAHVTSSPEFFFKFPEVDYCVAGEGEIVFYQLLQVLSERSTESIAGIPGVYFRNGEGINGVPRAFISNMEELPPPAWDLLDVESYFTNKYRRSAANPHYYSRRCLPIMTARGCPFRCIYCHDVAGRKVRAFSIDRILEEYDYLTEKLGAQEIEFCDDLFNYNLERATALLNAIAERNRPVRITLTNGLRADYLSDEFLDACKRAGVYRIVFAIESASPRIQQFVHKRLNLDKALENISKAAARHFSTGGYFMLGFPDETIEEMKMSIDFAVNSDLHTAGFSTVATFPNTELYDWALQKGFQLDGNYEDYNRIITNLSKVPAHKIEELRQEAFRRFYLSPKRVYRYLRDTPRNMFLTKAYIATRMTLLGDVDTGRVKFW
jgi:radical SAM superfamily enzyme YgiQ (UPF0313 family)